ncbi:hypothetical protein CYMTET_30750 [Cymbomonas tetramitiformis]|uniref:Uncharacterized protein n=1 Tax=Cymbomonas tetramitiformis TaxID=36881 RepID=A0AAE0KTT9_9CHLO|nr:hypothetical protein CYMTET_30750 [Cymbomonas tetramitiformis]
MLIIGRGVGCGEEEARVEEMVVVWGWRGGVRVEEESTWEGREKRASTAPEEWPEVVVRAVAELGGGYQEAVTWGGGWR